MKSLPGKASPRLSALSLKGCGTCIAVLLDVTVWCVTPDSTMHTAKFSQHGSKRLYLHTHCPAAKLQLDYV